MMNGGLTADREQTMFPLTDYQFAEGGGVLWTPRGLPDEHLQATLDLLHWRKQQDKRTPKARGTRRRATPKRFRHWLTKR